MARGEAEQVLPRRKAQHPEEIVACGANYNNTLTLLQGPAVQGLVEAEEDITAQMCFGIDLWHQNVGRKNAHVHQTLDTWSSQSRGHECAMSRDDPGNSETALLLTIKELSAVWLSVKEK